ncbi:unnamed protein product [Aphanomyces euteiches]
MTRERKVNLSHKSFCQKGMKMPLPPDYFQCPPLSPEECEQYERQALQNIQDLIEKADITNPRYEWQLVSHEAEIEIFRGKDPCTPTTALLFCSTVDLAATLDEVANFFRTRTRYELKEMADRTDATPLNSAELYTIQESQDVDIRVQWLLEKTPFDVVVKKRDFCLLKTAVNSIVGAQWHSNMGAICEFHPHSMLP